jgi:excisionase family DNA binding protein
VTSLPERVAWDELRAVGHPSDRHSEQETADQEDLGSLDLLRAAEYLGVSPTALHRLLDTGVLPWVRTSDVRTRRVRIADLDRHRDERYDLRHRLAAEARERRGTGTDLVGS